MLDLARRYLERILHVLEPELRAGTPIIVLEPSCCAVFRDELPALMPDHQLAQGLAQRSVLLSEFLMQHAAARLPKLRGKAIVQGHCHHKAIMRFDAQRNVLQAMELDADVLESGCCGMAGSFGFEADKYAVSQACGERVLLPRVREAARDTLVLADGFSCRTQIAQGSNRHALHLAEALQLALDTRAEDGVFCAKHEQELARRRERAIRRSIGRAALAVVALAAAAVGTRALARSRR